MKIMNCFENQCPNITLLVSKYSVSRNVFVVFVLWSLSYMSYLWLFNGHWFESFLPFLLFFFFNKCWAAASAFDLEIVFGFLFMTCLNEATFMVWVDSPVWTPFFPHQGSVMDSPSYIIGCLGIIYEREVDSNPVHEQRLPTAFDFRIFVLQRCKQNA